MTLTSAPVRDHDRIGWLTAWAAALAMAVFTLPFRLASAWPDGRYADVAALTAATRSGFLRFWADDGIMGPDLARAAAFWLRFHLIKAVLAGALFCILVVIGRRMLRRGATHRPWVARWSAATIVGIGTVLALLVLVANTQGTFAPLSSVLGLLPLRTPDVELARTVHAARGGLATGAGGRAIELLVRDFAVYHAAMVVLGTAVTLALLGVVIHRWRHGRPTGAGPAHRRRAVATLGPLTMTLAAFFAIVTAANLSTALHPVPALAGFLAGGL